MHSGWNGCYDVLVSYASLRGVFAVLKVDADSQYVVFLVFLTGMPNSFVVQLVSLLACPFVI